MNTEQKINHNLLVRIVLWNNNFGQFESLSQELFCTYFGRNMGEHYYKKWIYTYQQNFFKMVGYYGMNSKDVQLFCDMVSEQMQKYEERVNNR